MDPELIEIFLDALGYTENLDGHKYMAAAVRLFLKNRALAEENYGLFLEKLASQLETTPCRVKFVLSRTAASSWQYGRLFMLFEPCKRYEGELQIICAIASSFEDCVKNNCYAELFKRIRRCGYEERAYRLLADAPSSPILYTEI